MSPNLSGRLTIFLLIVAQIVCAIEARKCHQCSGIGCLRTSNTQTVDCDSDLDVCASVFNGATLQAQGCLQQLNEKLCNKCSIHKDTPHDLECTLCVGDLCNTHGPSQFKCVQCDSAEHPQCHTADLEPTSCPIARTENSFCYTKNNAGRLTRGCAINLLEQTNCLYNEECQLCDPFEIFACNAMPYNESGENTTTTTTASTSSGASTESTASTGTSSGSTSPTPRPTPATSTEQSNGTTASPAPTTSQPIDPTTGQPGSANIADLSRNILLLLIVVHFIKFISH